MPRASAAQRGPFVSLVAPLRLPSTTQHGSGHFGAAGQRRFDDAKLDIEKEKRMTLRSYLCALLTAGAILLASGSAGAGELVTPACHHHARFVTDDATYVLGRQRTAGGKAVDIQVYYASKSSYIEPVSVGWQLERADPSPFSTPLLGSSATVLGIYVHRCDGSGWANIASTPFAVYFPTETSSNGELTYSAVFNGELPGERVDPTWECGGEDITISTLIGPQTLRTNTSVEFAYVVEHER
jgi:hypothetical protein